MGNERKTAAETTTGLPPNTANRLTRSFLARHGPGLDDLLSRFPAVPGPAFRSVIEQNLKPGASSVDLQMSLEKACETLLSLRKEDSRPLPVDARGQTNIDAGIRWYAARFRDLAIAAQRM